jgi:hypothetical protein
MHLDTIIQIIWTIDHWIIIIKQYLNQKEIERSGSIVEIWKLRKIKEKNWEIHSQP